MLFPQQLRVAANRQFIAALLAEFPVLVGGLAIRAVFSVEAVTAHMTKRAKSFGFPAIRAGLVPFLQDSTAIAAKFSWHVHYVTFGTVHRSPLSTVFLELQIRTETTLFPKPQTDNKSREESKRPQVSSPQCSCPFLCQQSPL